MEANTGTVEHYLKKLGDKYKYMQEVVDENDMPMFAFNCFLMCEILIAILSDYTSVEELAEKDDVINKIVTNLGLFEYNFFEGKKVPIKIERFF